MSATLAHSPVNFHISLNASNLKRSVAFFTKVFGVEPAKVRDDYAKFEVTNPPLTLSLEPNAPSSQGALNHAGFRLANSRELVALQRRLEMAGLSSQREEGVECCYARQTKFWLHDPDGNLWEFYVIEGNIEHRGVGQTQQAVLGSAAASHLPQPILCDRPLPASTWSHRLGQAFPIPFITADGSLETVQLQGTFNGPIDVDALNTMLAEVLRVLQPGGRLAIHCLTADRRVSGALDLPGPAAVVKNVPVDAELLRSLEHHGYCGLRLTKFGSRPCFQFAGIQLRETMIEAFKEGRPSDGRPVVAVYKGPLREVVLDSGHALRRGERTELPASIWAALQAGYGSLRDDVVALESADADVVCTG